MRPVFVSRGSTRLFVIREGAVWRSLFRGNGPANRNIALLIPFFIILHRTFAPSSLEMIFYTHLPYAVTKSQEHMPEQTSLFGADNTPSSKKQALPTTTGGEPLAARMRPRTLDEIIG